VNLDVGNRAGPSGAAICTGQVWHCRYVPSRNEFTNRVSYVWVDPCHPDELTRHHPLWSTSRLAVAQLRVEDYGDGSERPDDLARLIRYELSEVLDRPVGGPVRMLSQARRWGWLFNPITVYFVWDDDDSDLIGAVLEVTNTPWKERHRYAVPLVRNGRHFDARFDKSLHVSPFLDEDYQYRCRVELSDKLVDVRLDVHRHGVEEPTVSTQLRLDRTPVSRSVLGRALRRPVFPTHAVSAGIHAQAVRLLAKRVPFISHPDKRAEGASNDASRSEGRE